MADIVTQEQRRKNMQNIKGKDTKPELYLRKLLFKEGFRYRLYTKTIPGHPDMWLKKYNTAIFVHGCFWHRHPGCKLAYMPKSRVDFWKEKFDKNIERDKRINADLQDKKIKVLIVWECTIRQMQKDKELEKAVLEKLCHALVSSDLYIEV